MTLEELATAALNASTLARDKRTHLAAAQANYDCADAFRSAGHFQTANVYQDTGHTHYRTAMQWDRPTDNRAHLRNPNDWRKKT